MGETVYCVETSLHTSSTLQVRFNDDQTVVLVFAMKVLFHSWYRRQPIPPTETITYYLQVAWWDPITESVSWRAVKWVQSHLLSIIESIRLYGFPKTLSWSSVVAARWAKNSVPWNASSDPSTVSCGMNPPLVGDSLPQCGIPGRCFRCVTSGGMFLMWKMLACENCKIFRQLLTPSIYVIVMGATIPPLRNS